MILQFGFLKIDVDGGPFWLGAAINEAPKFSALEIFRNPLWSRMRRILLLLLLLLFSRATYAQSIVTFTVTGTFASGSSYAPGSTITMDTSTGLVTASNITIEPEVDQFTLSNLTTSNPNEIFWANSASFGSLLIEPLSSFIGFTGGAVKLAEYDPEPGIVDDSTDTTFTPTCDLVFPDSLDILPDGPLSNVDKLPTAMTASFHPVTHSPLGIKIPTTLSAAKNACGYAGFNFQQLVTNYPPSFRGIFPPFLDPPPQFDPAGAYPFYYSLNELLKGINVFCDPGPVPVTLDDTSLNFCDAPQDPLIGLGQGVMQFETSLVGLPLVPNGSLNVLWRWNWTSSFDSQNGGVQIAKGGGTGGMMQATTNGGFGTGGVTLTSINGVPIATFSVFSNKLEATSTSFELVSRFTLGSTSDGIKPVTEATVLKVGSYIVTIPGGSFHKNSQGYYVYEGTINGESLQLQIAPGQTSNTYTLKAEGNGIAPISLVQPVTVVLKIGNDIGAGAATLTN